MELNGTLQRLHDSNLARNSAAPPAANQLIHLVGQETLGEYTHRCITYL